MFSMQCKVHNGGSDGGDNLFNACALLCFYCRSTVADFERMV
jgi:hypothetical protein